MSSRQVLAVFTLSIVLASFCPASASAHQEGMRMAEGPAPHEGLFAHLLIRATELVSSLSEVVIRFVTTEGSAITSNG